MLNFDLIPEQASTFAEKVDPLFYLLTLMSVVATTGIFLAIVYMAAKYRWKEGEDRPSHALESPALEITWTIIPTIIFLGIFAWGAILYNDYITTPEGDVLEIDVIAKQWMWKIQHPTGHREVNALHVPVGRPVELTMISQDVLHDFYVPAFRVKQDVLPGRFTRLWFEATKPGDYHLFCAEYCGTEHSQMIGTIHVLEPDEYVEWLEGGPEMTPVQAGEFLFSQRGCVTCHSGASGARGPDLTGVFGSDVLLSSGETVTADEEYLRESIMEPGSKLVEGYQPLMPSFRNQLTENEVMDLIAYIKSLAGQEGAGTMPAPAAAGQ